MSAILQSLTTSTDPIIRFKALCLEGNREAEKVRAEIPSSRRVLALLSERGADGKIPFYPYGKWYGAHWVLAQLAELDYPPGDMTLMPLVEQVLGWLSSPRHRNSILTIQGRTRRCASQEAYALFAILKLGLADERAEVLAHDLLRWQWPDGGWNCDKKPEANHSSFHETFIPLRALNLFAGVCGDSAARRAVERAAEVFLQRRLFLRLSDGQIINENMTRLYYPVYWHYNFLAGLKIMGECGRLNDPRCAEALDLLEKKRLADGGFPAEQKYYRVIAPQGAPVKRLSGASLVDWGKTSQHKSNEFVTLEALRVLKKAGRG